VLLYCLEDAPMFGVSGRDWLFADTEATTRGGSGVRRALWAAAPHEIARLAALFRLPGIGRCGVVLTGCMGRHDPASAAAAGAVLRPLVYSERGALRRVSVGALAQVADVYPGAVAGEWRWRVQVALVAQDDPRLASDAARLLARTAARRRPALAREAHLWAEIARSRGRGRVA
jgi:hypothetical protein